MNLKNFKTNHQKPWIVGLLTLYLITTTTLFYTFLKIIQIFCADPEISSDTVYVYQGGILATMYLALAFFLAITAITNGKFAEWLLDQKHITTVTRPKKFIAFICVGIVLAITTPKLI